MADGEGEKDSFLVYARPLALVVFLLFLVRTAWLCDDAYITLRTVDNFVHGFGLRWNIAERVQSYTNPAWMLLLSICYAVTNEPYYTTLALCMALSLAAVAIIILRIAPTNGGAALAMLAMLFSRAFMDYSTSGLENPLTHLLLALFLWRYLRGAEEPPRPRESLLLGLLAGLSVLNRMDTALFFVFPLSDVLYRSRPRLRAISAMVPGAALVVVWLLFATLYYGAPFPNTAYAKLGSGLPQTLLYESGALYLLNAVSWDPVTVVALLASLVVCAVRRRRAEWAVALGMVLYLAYIVRVGGDFMSGRFLAAPFLCAVALLARLARGPQGVLAAAGAVIVGLGLVSAFPPVRSVENYSSSYSLGGMNESFRVRGVNDERAWYYPNLGLLRAERGALLPRGKARNTAREYALQGGGVVLHTNMGIPGFYAGPYIHLVDTMALSDPLLARLPSSAGRAFLVGHFTREIPEGYIEALEGSGAVADPFLAEFWEQIKLITRAPIFAPGRIKAIWKLNTGGYDGLIREYCLREYYYAGQVLEQAPDGAPPVVNGTEPAPENPYLVGPGGFVRAIPWDAPGNVLSNEYGVGFRVDAADLECPEMQCSLLGGYRYQILYFRGHDIVASQDLDLNDSPYPGMVSALFSVPDDAMSAAFDRFRILPADGAKRFALGYLQAHLKPVVERSFESLATKPYRGAPWFVHEAAILHEGQSLRVVLPTEGQAKHLELSAFNSSAYQVRFLREGNVLASHELPAQQGEVWFMPHTLPFPETPDGQRPDCVEVQPTQRQGGCSIGHIRLMP